MKRPEKILCGFVFGVIAIVTCAVAMAQETGKTDRGPATGDRTAAASIDPKSAVPAPIPLKLSTEDQKQLDLINGQMEQMKPQLELAKKQQKDELARVQEASAKLQAANAFLAEYDKVDAVRMAFLFRIAADEGYKSSEVSFSADGKSVVRKPKVEAAKGK